MAIAVAPDGQPWIVNKQGTIFRRTRGQTSYVDGAWELVPGQASRLAVGGDGSVWAIGTNQSNLGGNYIYHYNPNVAGGWELVDGGATGISVDANGVPWLVNKLGAVFKRALGANGYVDGSWVPVAPNGTATNIGEGGPLF